MTGQPDPYFNKRYEADGPQYFREKSQRERSDKHENDVAKRSGDRRRSGSGSTPGKPADVVGMEYLRECKRTHGAGTSIAAVWLRKICEQAMNLGRTPMIELRLEGAKPPVPVDWVLVTAEEWERVTKGKA